MPVIAWLRLRLVIAVTLGLVASLLVGSGSATAGFGLPKPVLGRTTWSLNADSPVELFIALISTPNTTILLGDDVNLDLTGKKNLGIETGVHIIGNRSSTNPGPRLFTRAIRTAGPQPLFQIGQYVNGDGVRIIGVRIDGGDMGIAGGAIIQDDDKVTPVGIRVTSSVNVEIANNEIFGWSGTAVEVQDPPERNRLGLANASAVWVHDNYIHNNQRYRHLGYGVAPKEGAQVLIERNVFDKNRHAIESSGATGTGYRAYQNLVLPGGGVNADVPLYGKTYTHEFDVHGTRSCDGKDAYCGQAGEYFDYRYNTMLYTNGDGIKVRGTPTIRAHATKNVFIGSSGSGAVSQTVGNNFLIWDNKFRADKNTMLAKAICDFDGDGSLDDFLATGATWWWMPAGAQASGYFYLNTSNKLPQDLNFFQATGRCDLQARSDGTVFTGGRTRSVAKRSDVVWTRPFNPYDLSGMARVWRLNSDLSGASARVTLNLATKGQTVNPGGVLLGTGDFNADGAADLLWRDTLGQVWIQLRDQNAVGIPPGDLPWNPISNEEGGLAGIMPLSTSFQGVGDFNGDGRADILWRRPDGQLLLWPAGESGNRALVTYNNDVQIDPSGTVYSPKEVPVPLEWKVKGVGDFNHDGYSDILWQNESAHGVLIWYMQHAMHIGDSYAWTVADGSLVQGVGDFDGDGYSDVLWRDASSGRLNTWFRPGADGGHQDDINWQNRPGYVTGPEWTVLGVGDFDGDGCADILWRNFLNTSVIWKMNGKRYLGESAQLPGDNSYRQFGGLMTQAQQRISLN